MSFQFSLQTTVLVFILFCGLLVGGAILYTVNRTGPALDATREWLALLRRQDYRAAYDGTSAGFRERQTLADLEAFARAHQFSLHTELRLGRRAAAPDTAVFTGWLGSADGKSAIALSIGLRKSPAGVWQPERLEVGEAVGRHIVRDGSTRFGPPGLYDS
ncbi:hypothetical protein [Azospirillum endophyticum]